MNLAERTQLDRFLQLLGQAQTGPRDAEAEGLIRDACLRQPDAAYLLVQRVLQLEREVQAAQKSSFIGDANAWGRAPIAFQPSTKAPEQTPVQQASAPAGAAPASAWGSGLLGNVAGAAAGVVAGSLLAHGIGSLMGHHADAGRASNPAEGATLAGLGLPKVPLEDAEDAADGGYVADDFDAGT